MTTDFSQLCSGLYKLLQKYDLCDVWRHLNLGVRDYTHHSQQFASYSRIDYLLVSNSLNSNLVTSDIGLRIWSDHAWVDGQLHLYLVTKPQSHWKLSSNLLYLEPLHTEIEKKIQDYFDSIDSVEFLHGTCGML